MKQIGTTLFFLTVVFQLFAQSVEHSIERGFYNAAFTLNLSTDLPAATIMYSLDEGLPSQTYNGSLTIAQTSTIRSQAYNSTDTTAVATHSYIFPADVVQSPVMISSIVNDPTYGSQMEAALLSIPTISIVSHELLDPIDTSLLTLPTSLEYILPDGSEGFQIDCGVENYGGWWVWNSFDKKNFRLKFKSEFGPKKLKYPLFEGYDKGVPAADEFDQLNLRSGSHDMVQRGFYMSNRFMDDMMLEMGNAVPHGRFVHLYFNGDYWGQYHMRERFNNDFLASYHGGNDDDYDCINGNVNVGGWAIGHAYDGDSINWETIKDSTNLYVDLKDKVDLKNYVDFMLTFFLGYAENEYRCGGAADFSRPYTFFYNDADGWLRAP